MMREALLLLAVTSLFASSVNAQQAQGNTAQQVRDSVAQADSAKKLIADSLKTLSQQPYHTSFIAEGAVLNTLKTGGGAAPATGSLGILQVSPHERFTALLTLASSVDTISGSGTTAPFAPAILVPQAGKGNAASGSADYYRHWEYGHCHAPDPADTTDTSAAKNRQALAEYNQSMADYKACEQFYDRYPLHQQYGFRLYASFAKQTWRVVNAKMADSLSDLTILAGGARFVWVPINHPLDENGNEFSLAAEIGWTVRGLAGDIADEDDLKQAVIQTKHGVFNGPELALSIRLNHVTGSALLPWLGALGGPKLHGLTGLQPIVSFSVDAPVFTF